MTPVIRISRTRGFAICLLVIALVLIGATAEAQSGASAAPSDQDIIDAYEYVLGRLLVIRQLHMDLGESLGWNTLNPREPDLTSVNPDLSMIMSDALIALDDKTAAILELPNFGERYYTFQVLDSWGQTVLNINSRTFPQHPNGKFALCLKGSSPKIPNGALRVDVRCRTCKGILRIEAGSNPREAVELQWHSSLTEREYPEIEELLDIRSFTTENLPDANAFEYAKEILTGAPDPMAGMDVVRSKVKAVAPLLHESAATRSRLNVVILGAFIFPIAEFIQQNSTEKNGWSRLGDGEKFANSYMYRTSVNFVDIWKNQSSESTYFTASYDPADAKLECNAVYKQSFPKDALPSQSGYSWSITAIDAAKHQVMPNALNRFFLGKYSTLVYANDGSLTLAFAKVKPIDVPESNWLPCSTDGNYQLIMRFYVPSADITDGTYYPPPLVK